MVLWLRRGNGFTQRFHEIAGAPVTPPDTLIAGEVIAIDRDTGRCSFNALQHSRPNAAFLRLVSWCIADVAVCCCRWRNGAGY